MRYKEILRAPEEEPGQGAGGAGIGGEAAEDQPALIPETETHASSQEHRAESDEPEVDYEAFETEEDLAHYLEEREAESEELGAESEEQDEEAESDEAEAEPEDSKTDEEEAESKTEKDKDQDKDQDLETAELWKKLPKEHRNTVRELIRQSVTERLAKEGDKRTELEAKVKAAETRAAGVEELEAQITHLKAAKVMPVATPEDPLADVGDLQTLDLIERDATRIDDWMDLHLEELKQPVEDPETGEMKAATLTHPLDPKRTIDYETARKLKLQVKQDLRALPRKREWFRQQAAIERELHEKVPSLKDPKSALSKQVAETIAAMPWMKQSPGYRVAALHYNVGRLLNKAADEAGVGVEAMLERLSAELGAKSQEPRAKSEGQKPLPSGEQLKAPAKPVARPVPAVRKTPATTGKAKPKAGFIDSLEDLTETLLAQS